MGPPTGGTAAVFASRRTFQIRTPNPPVEDMRRWKGTKRSRPRRAARCGSFGARRAAIVGLRGLFGRRKAAPQSAPNVDGPIMGDPEDPRTICGPMISSSAADKVMDFVNEAVSAGAKVIAGGMREGNMVRPTLVEDVPK